MAPTKDPLEYLKPTALDGSVAAAQADHIPRANNIAQYFALTRPLEAALAPLDHGQADENVTVALIANLHAASHDPDFAVPGQEKSKEFVPKVLRRLNCGDGQVGTNRDYDMALKGLMPIAYRYRHLLSNDDFKYLLNELLPPNFAGGQFLEDAFYHATPVTVFPETENHLLMIESSRYLANQLLHDDHPQRANMTMRR